MSLDESNPISPETHRRLTVLEGECGRVQTAISELRTSHAVFNAEVKHLNEMLDKMLDSQEQARRENKDGLRKLLYPVLILIAGVVVNFMLRGGLLS